MDNTTMPLLGIVGFPITLLFGSIATHNVLIDLAIFASTLSFFAMARRFVTWWPAAFVGGLAYGFSPFTAATGNAHLFLLFRRHESKRPGPVPRPPPARGRPPDGHSAPLHCGHPRAAPRQQ